MVDEEDILYTAAAQPSAAMMVVLKSSRATAAVVLIQGYSFRRTCCAPVQPTPPDTPWHQQLYSAHSITPPASANDSI
jgi:hypothetical protein